MLQKLFEKKRPVFFVLFGLVVVASIWGFLIKQKAPSNALKENSHNQEAGNMIALDATALPPLKKNDDFLAGRSISNAPLERFTAFDVNRQPAPSNSLIEQEVFRTQPQENWHLDKATLPREALGYEINYDMKYMDTKKIGDQLSFPIPEAGISVRGVVEDVQSNAGLKTWSGPLSGGVQSGKFSITHASADDYAVGTVEFGVYSYEIESIKGSSKIVLQRDLNNRKID